MVINWLHIVWPCACLAYLLWSMKCTKWSEIKNLATLNGPCEPCDHINNIYSDTRKWSLRDGKNIAGGAILWWPVLDTRYLPHLLGCLLTAPPVTNQIFATINCANDNSAIFCQHWVTVCLLQVAINLWPQDPVYEWPLLNIFKYLFKISINKL